MARHATIIATLPDAWGDLWDIRESVPTQYGFSVLRGWPVGIPRGRGGSGGPRVILTAELVALLEKHRMESGKLQLPFSAFVLKRLRKMLGHHRGADVAQWWEDRADELASLPISEFAAKYGVQISSASVWNKRFFGNRLRPAGWWHEGSVEQLLMADLPIAYKAEELGCSLSSIRRLIWATRQRLGIELTDQDRADITEKVIAKKRGQPAHANTKAALLAAAKKPKSDSHRKAMSEAHKRRKKTQG